MLRLPPDAEPYPLFNDIRAAGNLVASRLGFHLTATYDVAKAVLQDDRFGVASPSRMTRPSRLSSSQDDHPIDDWFVFRNPPAHTRLRHIVTPFFTARAVDTLTPLIEHIVDETMGEVARRAEFDLVEDFALRVSMRTVCAVLGVPRSEFEQLLQWGPIVAESLHETPDPAKSRQLRGTLAEVADYFAGLLRRRTACPDDDLVSWLATARLAGRITLSEIIACCQLVLVAGFETMASLFASAVHILLENPALRAKLSSRGDRGAAFLNEVLRLHPPVRWVSRRTQEPLTLAGVRLPADAGVAVLVAGANRDPAAFAEPDALDLDRSNGRHHLAFAAGAHYCLGAGLARRQATIALSTLFRRYPDLQQAGPLRHGPSRTLRTTLSMPVRTASSESVMLR